MLLLQLLLLLLMLRLVRHEHAWRRRGHRGMVRGSRGMLAIWRLLRHLILLLRVVHLLRHRGHGVLQRSPLCISLWRVDRGRRIRLRRLIARDWRIRLTADCRLRSHAFVRFCKAGQSQTKSTRRHCSSVAINAIWLGVSCFQINWFQLTRRCVAPRCTVCAVRAGMGTKESRVAWMLRGYSRHGSDVRRVMLGKAVRG